MSIPRAVIPQANMQQAMPLLAQFNAARAAAQGQPVPIIRGGQGINPAQLMQYNQGNALQVGSRIDGRQGGTPAVRVGQDDRARERYLENVEQNIFNQDRIDSRAIYESDRADARTIYNNQRADERANDLKEDQRKNTELSHQNSIALARFEDELRRKSFIDEQKILDTKRDALQGKFGQQIQKPILDYHNWTQTGKRAKYEELKTDFIRSKLMDPKLSADFALDPVGKQYVDAGQTTTNEYFIALADFIRKKLDAGDKELASQFAPSQLILNRMEDRLRALSDQAQMFALKNFITYEIPSSQPEKSPPSNQPSNAIVPEIGGVENANNSTTTNNGNGGTTGNPLLTPAQNKELIDKFEGLDADGSGTVSEAEIQGYLNNPLISKDTADMLTGALQRIVPAALAANFIFRPERGVVGAEKQIDKQIKELDKSPAPIDEDTIKSESKTVTQAQKDKKKAASSELSSAQTELDSAQKTLDQLESDIEKAKQRRVKIVKARQTLMNGGEVPDDIGNLSQVEAEIADLDTKLKQANEALSSAKMNVEVHQDRLDNLKAKEGRYGKNPSQDKARLSADPEVKQRMQYNSNMRAIGKRFNITESEISEMIGEDGRISKSALRDKIAKQEIGSISKLLGKIFPGKGFFKTSGKIGLVGGIGFAPDIVDAIKSSNLSREEREQAKEELRQLIEDFKSLNDNQSNALTP